MANQKFNAEQEASLREVMNLPRARGQRDEVLAQRAKEWGFTLDQVRNKCNNLRNQKEKAPKEIVVPVASVTTAEGVLIDFIAGTIVGPSNQFDVLQVNGQTEIRWKK